MTFVKSVPIAEINKLPFVRRVPDHGRVLPLRAYWDADAAEGHLYFPVSPTELGRMGGGEPVVGSYLSSEPADAAKDREWPLGSSVLQHLSFPDVLPWLDKFEHRYYQLAVALEKYDVVAHPVRERSEYCATSEMASSITATRRVPFSISIRASRSQ